MKQALFLTLLMLVAPFVALSSNVENSENQTFGLDQVIDISERELTPEQMTALAGARVSSGNWLHHVGGIGSDEGVVSRIASNGDLYIGGKICHGAGTCSAIFGSTTIYANNDIFVAKLASNGTWLWVAQTTGTNSNSYSFLTDMAIDSFGHVFISGYYKNSKNWGTISESSTGGMEDGFAARLSVTGTWGWVRTIENNDYGYARGIAVDSNQNVYVTGESRLYYSNSYYRSVSFPTPTTTPTISTNCNSWRYWPWLVKYDGTGTYQWVDRLSDNCNDRYMRDVITDSNDSVIVTGYFDYTLSFQSMSTTSSGSWDVFLAKVDSSHNWQWLTHGGGLSSDEPEKLGIDSNDDIIVVGYNSNHASYGTTIILASSGGFVVKALGNGTWEWGTRITPSFRVEDVAVHSNNNLTVVGASYIVHLNSTGTQQWYENNANSIYSVVLDANETAYFTGYFNGIQTFENHYLVSNGSNDLFIWKWDRDRDGDSVADRLDNCGDHTNGNQDDYDNDGPGDVCDADDDNDGFLDVVDNCPQGDMNWTSNSTTDRDVDGCQDSGEDIDDDDDGIIDTLDVCHPTGLLNWTSDGTTDHDSDGCKDDVEDTDDDNDGIADISDSCSHGDLDWLSNSTTDHDSDGCQDIAEDQDDDDDAVLDTQDDCPEGDIGWTSDGGTDHDMDGCQDSLEDQDDDGDAALDTNDLCPRGVLNWIRYVSADYDDDGCRDSDEDADDDNDGVTDHSDICYLGERNWTSTVLTDNDADGCRDLTEDSDDDNDGISDVNDFCPQGDIGWTSGKVTDHDSDGCNDASEDLDDDGDGILDSADDCDKGMTGWTSNGGSDYDGDGCLDATEDGDDDGDGVTDYADPCPYGEENCVASGGGGGNVTIIHQYPENSTNNDSAQSPIYQNTTYVNNTYVFVNNTYENDTFQNNTNMNQTINEGNFENETIDDTTNSASAESLTEMSWIPIVVVILMIMLLFIQALHLVKKPIMPAGPPESMLAEQSLFEAVDFTADITEKGEEIISESVSTIDAENDNTHSTSPPAAVDNLTISDGFEWVEWPEGSGQNHFRAEGSQDEWQQWPIE